MTGAAWRSTPDRRRAIAGRLVGALSFAIALMATEAPGAGPLGADEGLITISGDSTVEAAYYDVSGDRSGGLYRELGAANYGQVNLAFDWRQTPYRSLRGEIRMLANDSPYRSSLHGFQLEQARLTLEDGGAVIPFRFDLGDAYGFFTTRTLQRTLKGAIAEVQVGADDDGPHHSLVVLGGTHTLPWRDLQLRRDLTLGSSWLADWTRGFSTSVNWVRNSHAEDAARFQPERRQYVGSIASELVIHDDHRLETEYAILRQSQESLSGGPTRTVRAEAAQVSLSGRVGEPATYGLRLESADDGFVPAGSSAFFANRRVAEVTAGYQVAAGWQLRSRLQRIRDGWQSVNPFDTTLGGLTANAQLPGGWYVGVDGFIRDQSDRARSFDGLTRGLSATASVARKTGWTPSAGLYLEDRQSDLLGQLDRRIIDLRTGVAGTVRALGVDAHLAPGLVVRHVTRNDGNDDDLFPELRMTLTRGHHSLTQSLGLLAQQPFGARDGDLKTLSYLIGYRFRSQMFELGLDLDTFNRQPDLAPESTSWRAAAYVTRRFHRQLGALPLAMRSGVTASKGFELLDLSPGRAEASVNDFLTGTGLVHPRQIGRLAVYNRTFYYEVLEGQQLVLDFEAGRLLRAAIVFDDFYDPDPARIDERFNRIRQALIQRYGTPSEVFERGEAGADVVADIRGGTYVRVVEWRSPNGLLRLGIPRRSDGVVRIELQHASSLPPLGDPGWSVFESSASMASNSAAPSAQAVNSDPRSVIATPADPGPAGPGPRPD